jgi:hypothetical protein
MRGRKPKPTALHILHGTFRRHRHGNRIDAPAATPTDPATKPSELGEAEQAERRRELDAMRARLYGSSGPPDPGPRSGGNARRIRW